MDNFKENIKEWVRLDNEIKYLNKQISEIREHKSQYLEQILRYHNQENISTNSIIISDGRLRISTTKLAKPISIQFLKACLSDIIESHEDVEKIIDYINEKRNYKTEQNIKRYYNK